MTFVDFAERGTPIRALLALDIRDDFAERRANVGRSAPVATGPTGALSVELRAVTRNGSVTPYRIPVAMKRTTNTVFAAFEPWQGSGAGWLENRPMLENCQAQFVVESEYYQTADVVVVFPTPRDGRQTVRLQPGISYPLAAVSLTPGLRQLTMLRGTVNIQDPAGRIAGLARVALSTTPQGQFVYTTSSDGRFVSVLQDQAPRSPASLVTVTASPDPGGQPLAIVPGTSTSAWGAWGPHADGSFSINGMVTPETTPTIPDLVLQRP
jgi:hypothetical protein